MRLCCISRANNRHIVTTRDLGSSAFDLPDNNNGRSAVGARRTCLSLQVINRIDALFFLAFTQRCCYFLYVVTEHDTYGIDQVILSSSCFLAHKQLFSIEPSYTHLTNKQITNKHERINTDHHAHNHKPHSL